MFTVCPKCALTLVVTAADLRVAQGYVRCGRCLNVFNALARLSEERPAPAPPQEPAADAAPEQAAPQAAAQSSLDDTGEIEIELDASILIASAQAQAPLEEAVPAEPAAEDHALAAEPPAPVGDPYPPDMPQLQQPPTPVEHPVALQQPSAPVEHPAALQQLSTPEKEPVPQMQAAAEQPAALAPSAPGEPAAEPAPSPRAAADADLREADVITGGAEAVPAPAAGPALPSEGGEPSAAQAADAQQTNTAQQPAPDFELAPRRPRTGWAWKLGAGVLALALALQIVNHYRDTLAARPALGGPLNAVYSAMGVTLSPQWDVHAYEVRQLGASIAGAAAGEIIVRASVKNSANRAQPLPLLRVTLQDRFGNRIAARDVPPRDYLPSSGAPGALLAAGSRADATMVFVDPGPQAVGFEIDACLRERSGAVRCAHGP